MSKFNQTRRDFLQNSALMAGGLAVGSIAGVLPASADRSKELNILCWEGYNSAQVLDPFRTSTGATVRAESLTNDPTMINRLRAGETNIWDLINVNNPWARKVMYPEGLIKPIDKARFEPYFDKMLPAFKAPYKWAMDDAGDQLLGMAQRFGPYSFVVNTDKISRATAEDQGWDLWNDAANDKKYGVQASDDWNVFDLCCIAGFDPFREHTDEEVTKYTDAARRVFTGARMVGDLRHHEPGPGFGRDRFLPHRRNVFLLAGPCRRQFEHSRDYATAWAIRGWQGRHLVDRDHLGGQQS